MYYLPVLFDLIQIALICGAIIEIRQLSERRHRRGMVY